MKHDEFIQKWRTDQAPSRRAEFDRDVMMLLKPTEAIMIDTGVSRNDLRGVVNVRLGDKVFQYEANEARTIAQQFMEAAANAGSDAACLGFFCQSEGLGIEDAARIVAAFRHWRLSSGGSVLDKAVTPLKQ